MGDDGKLEEKVIKLTVRLKSLQEGKQLDTLVQIMEDLRCLADAQHCAAELFEDKDVHLPLMVVLTSYMDSRRVQQVGLLLLCRLLEICPSTLDKLIGPAIEAGEWEVLAVHRQILKVLSVHHEHSQLMTLGLQILAYILASDAIMLMVLEDDMDVFDLVVSAMTRFQTSGEIQFHGCKCLQLLLEHVPEEHLVEFIEKEDHIVVLKAARSFRDQENVLLQALRVLYPLAGPASNVEILMSGNERCYTVISLAMESFQHNQALQEIGCSLFQKFTSESYYSILVLNGVHRVIVRACMMYPENMTLQASGLSCLAALTKTVFLSTEMEGGKEEAEEREEPSWFGICCSALELHTSSAQVQGAACRAVHSLLLHDSRIQQALRDADGRTPIHRQIMAAILLHSSSLDVFQAATSALESLIDHDRKVRALLLSSGIHINVVEMMKKHSSSPEVAESACKLLHQLFQGRTAGLDELIMAMCEILKAMKVHNLLPNIQLEAMRASLTFLNPDRSLKEHGISLRDPDAVDISLKVLKNQCLVEGAHAVYLEALNRFIGLLDVQLYGLRVLSALVDSSGAVDLMCQQGAIDTVLHTLQMYHEESEIHYWGLNLLHELVSKKQLSRMMVPVLTSVVVDSVRRHQAHAEVHLKGFQVALKLLDMFPAAASELETEDFDRVIFHHLSRRPAKQRADPVHRLSCLCLSKMATNSDITYVMLEKACIDGDVTMADCLIRLGADVNKKTKTESLIYQVCERGEHLQLLELLLSSGVHEQHLRSALSAGIHRWAGPVVTLLLAKLGLDLNNNALCLGGFRLGRIEAALLSPLFECRAPSFGRRTSKGMSLARVILSYQRRKAKISSSRVVNEVCSSGYLSDESEDLSLFSAMDGCVNANSDVESDGSDGTSNIKSKFPSDVFEERNGQHRSPEASSADSDQSVPSHRNFSTASPRRKSNLSPVFGGMDCTSPLGGDREHVRLLDLSGNELDSLSCLTGDSVTLQHLEHVVRLELSQNNLVEFPELLCQSLRNLTRLDLHGNHLTSLPAGLLGLPSLSVLNVSRNCVGPQLCLPPAVQCPSLRQFNLSFNHIAVFPDLLGQSLEKLEELSLEGNRLTGLSSPLLLPEMRLLDISRNSIERICQDALTSCLRLETLNASMNKLSCFSSLPSKLTTLKLADNNFTCVPEVILQLPLLRSLDMRNSSITVLPGPVAWTSVNLSELIFSHNRIALLDISEPVYKWARLEKLHLADNMLTEIPSEIGLLENLTSLDVSRNEGLRSFPDEMGKLSRLWDLPLDGLRLNMNLKHIGNKTKDIVRFLQQRLKKAAPYFRMKLIMVGNSRSGKTTLVQQLMKLRRSQWYADQLSEAIYVQDWSIRVRDKRNIVLNVWDFSGGEKFSSSHSHFMSQRAMYIVVFNLSKGPSEVEALKPWLFNIKAIAPLSPVILVGTHTDVCEDHQLQACLAKIKGELLLHQGFPAIRDYHMVNACEDSDPMSRLRKAVIREATGFKTSLLKCACRSEQRKGIMRHSVAEKLLLESRCFPKRYFAQYLKLLEKFQVALPFGEDQLLIPSSLPHRRPMIELPHCENSEVVVRLYEMPYFPMDFWSRHINRLLEISSSLLSAKEKALRPNQICWRTGIYLNWSPEAYCLVESTSWDEAPQSFVKITVPCSREGHILLGQVVDHIDSLLEEWFPGLLTTDIHGSGEMLLKKWVLYSFEDGQEWSKMLLEDLLTRIKEDYRLTNPSDPRSTVPISQIAPDLILRDLPAGMMLNTEELEIDLSKEYLLGDGGFGSVYRAVYKNEEVAVKIFNKHASEMDVLRQLRQELAVLGRLHHPSLVSLLAAGTSPPLLVMELAPCGSLDSLFQHENGNLNRKLQHRIALQVADGLRFLHASMIVYRDLKPHNILLFNLKTDSEIIAKITDYGIAQYCCSMGVRTSEGTPGFRAPEVVRGNVIYNQQADVFSFGLLMYDLLTCGERMFDGMKFPSEFDEIAVQGKLPDPVKHYGCSPWPLFEDLMKHCMKENPQERPSASEVFDKLNSGEMLCLMRRVDVCRVPNAECFAVARGGDASLCVSVGGGSSSQRRGCVTSVVLSSGKLTAQEIDSSPILCLVTVRVPEEGSDWLVAGTQAGSLIVINTADMSVLHRLQRVTDAVTSLFFHCDSEHRHKRSHLLVGTADGVLAVYDESEIQYDSGQPLKTLHIGTINTPIMSLGQSGCPLDGTTIWAGCGTQVLGFNADYDVLKTIETKLNCFNQWGSETNISRLAVDKHIYVSKVRTHTVEVWDRKSERMSNLIDCAQILRQRLRVSYAERELETGMSWASVKALLIQHNTSLWIGTRGGHVILMDLSTCLPLQVIGHLCQSVRSMMLVHADALNPRNVVLVLGRSRRTRREEARMDYEDDSTLLVWNSTLPQEVRDLKKHCDMRMEIADKMRTPRNT
ncbi:leucine-rich repeat serine/threonine-protein kinase 2 isoform X5 [Brienomyrus brachyistius]|uniref:leucine-rich repeat serine/threonine-protein kinase 2 isoform X5 n=1 Tax=Brienomyrus brachyistius TaxID=42636 RepID=UPI0020B435E0|nr:leucine-rich repeat serine/threonine-protein kinase 2 isoform X5 [Brienomyrus brachyistius]